MRLFYDKSINRTIRQLARFYAIDTTAPKVADIGEVFPELTPDYIIPEPDELVEDAGLYDSLDDQLASSTVSTESVSA